MLKNSVLTGLISFKICNDTFPFVKDLNYYRNYI